MPQSESSPTTVNELLHAQFVKPIKNLQMPCSISLRRGFHANAKMRIMPEVVLYDVPPFFSLVSNVFANKTPFLHCICYSSDGCLHANGHVGKPSQHVFSRFAIVEFSVPQSGIAPLYENF